MHVLPNDRNEKLHRPIHTEEQGSGIDKIWFSNTNTGFRDVLGHEPYPDHMREHSQLRGWSSDENEWDEHLYPVWRRGDGRWKDSWEGKWEAPQLPPQPELHYVSISELQAASDARAPARLW